MNSILMNVNSVQDFEDKLVGVADFAIRYNLDEREASRLVELFGDFATKHELFTNARIPRSFRWSN